MKSFFSRKSRGNVAVSACFFLLCFSKYGLAYDWDYSKFKFELSEKAVFSPKKNFQEWKKEPLAYFKEQANSLKDLNGKVVSKNTVNYPNYDRVDFSISFSDNTANNTYPNYNLVIFQPKHLAKKKRHVVVLFDGHSDVNGEGHGQSPVRMFEKNNIAEQLVLKGYTVIGIPTAIHQPFSELAKNVDYPIIWAKFAQIALKVTSTDFFEIKKYSVVGNAIGGLTALSLSLIDENVSALFVHGAFFPLELTRREYRIKDHPFCHDFRAFNTYTTVYALLAPRPVAISVGRKDALWLGQGASPATSWFSGIKRGATVDETLGAYLVLNSIWNGLGGQLRFLITDAEHEGIDTHQVINFLGSH